MQNEQHYIEIENFSTLKHCRIDLRRFNVFIGPQASGKSVIAKLLFFFAEFPNVYFRKGVLNDWNKKSIDRALRERFEQIFPKYSWELGEYSIKYRRGEVEVRIDYGRTAAGKAKLAISYPENVMQDYRKYKSGHKKIVQEIQNKLSPEKITQFLEDISADRVRHYIPGYIPVLSNPLLFIPASRSFFSNLQSNIFTFLAENINIDPFMSEFGSAYESIKRFYGEKMFSVKQKHGELRNRILISVLQGEYMHKDHKDWIQCKHGTINIANASSGQQEALPMLLMLCTIPFTRPFGIKKSIYIEEPEAHLFPFAQKNIVALLSLIYANTDHEITLTTHSPYILSAMNVLITAHDYAKKHGVDKAREIIGDAMPIAFEDVAAYTVEKGTARSIMDPETRLVGESIIDAVSDSFAAEFDRLLEDE